MVYSYCQNEPEPIPPLCVPQDGDIGLYMAAQNGHLEVARLLLDSRADPNLAREVSRTPFPSFAPLFPAYENIRVHRMDLIQLRAHKLA
jgi:ankyrin repeat protein